MNNEKKYWNPAIETLPAEDLKALQWRRLKKQLQYNYTHSEFYREEKFHKVNLTPEDINTFEDFQKIPLMTKDEHRRTQEESLRRFGHPYGLIACAPIEKIIRINSTSGTTGQPTLYTLTKNDIDVLNEMHARKYWRTGLRPGNIVLQALSLSMFTGGLPLSDGLQAMGLCVVPVGIEGGTQRVLDFTLLTRPDVLIATPSFGEYLIEQTPKLIGKEARELGIRWFYCAGEPGAGIPSLRKKLQDGFGAKVFDHTGGGHAFHGISCDIEPYPGMHFVSADLVAIVTDDFLRELLTKLFNAPEILKCLFIALIAALIYYYGIKRKKKNPEKVFSNEAIFFLGVLATAGSITFLGRAIDTGSGHFSVLILLAAIIYGILGLWFPSKLVWIFALISIGSWLGTETGYMSGWGAYWLGMNYPLRFVLFGTVLTASSFAFYWWQARKDFLRPTRAIGLLNLFIALWIMSIFGNYGDMHVWEKVKQIELFHWSLIFGLAAIASIYHGVKEDDGMTRGFGITFLFINLYTRFFEHFWNNTHKAIFFAILAVSFWYLGSRAEKIWYLGRSPKQDKAAG